MNTSQTGFLSEILIGGKVSVAKLAYFRERLRTRIHQFILREFISKQRDGFTQADLARMLDRRPEQIHRWLGAPSNWTLDTVSDLVLAISKAELDFRLDPFDRRPSRNFHGPDWITNAASSEISTVTPVTLAVTARSGATRNVTGLSPL
jgi:hypothetical protein